LKEKNIHDLIKSTYTLGFDICELQTYYFKLKDWIPEEKKLRDKIWKKMDEITDIYEEILNQAEELKRREEEFREKLLKVI